MTSDTLSRPSAPPVAGPTLSARDLTKTYGMTTALAGVDVDLHPGESVAVMGASGSGKTTLLHCLAGIIRPSRGTVLLTTGEGPIRVDALPDSQRSWLRRDRFGFVFQDGLLLPELTAGENVAMALMLQGTPRRPAEEYAAQWLAHLGLAGLEQRRIGQLSGGQAQRVAIARAQVTGADVVFADEPTGALDHDTSREVLQVLIQATVGRGRTLVVVTHDDDVAAQCSRVIELRDGRVVGSDRR